jgi:hypothetical protein
MGPWKTPEPCTFNP